ncbi:hypothetical protein GCM10023322_39070 [Rugosimonospora acidiphila]|uniref:DUF4352 domain-containing protein n=1 Tax=Rugosimonospora acidiphila TaxID=556531 RepID=A0ABP9RYB5_9ACTN
MTGRPATRGGYASKRGALLTVLFAGLTAGLTGGCGGQTTGSPGPIVTPPPGAGQQPPSVSPGSAPQGHAIGETVTANNGFISATVFGYDQPAAAAMAPDRPGDEWAAADIQTCAESGSVFEATVSDGPWSLRYPDDSSIVATRTSSAQFPKPAYPSSPQSLRPGQCLRGWVVFAVPAGKRPQIIRYAPQGATPVDWLAQ